MVPGTGVKWTDLCDDFEDEKWSYVFNHPKASAIQDEQQRFPLGASTNGKWSESGYRGTPDVVRRIATPPGGLPGSKGALLIGTKDSGIPGMLTYKDQQDDLLMNISTRIGGHIPVAYQPSMVVRVYIPEWDQFEKRTGSSFGFRADVWGMMKNVPEKGPFGIKRFVTKEDSYWPGFFIQFNRKADGYPEDNAILLIRGDQNGHEIRGPWIRKPGWWTLGMSFTGDGQVHYYAHEGLEKLTARDHLVSTYPYNARAEKLYTFFFNVVCKDDGRTWSTPWVIDDPELYYVPNGMAMYPQGQPMQNYTPGGGGGIFRR